ncbi:MAG: dephospho-CoA kinase [Candidatus Pelagibacter sp. TMED196]|nr:MAG: dephospho-CoA kinase [Candidatus Pelagibacter sp. TMED196]|tara:strand:- start:1556 stop:2119 length:564 start_codon:yes stop_codon:yes gene_type:complete
MIKIGITGSLASGKTTAARIFAGTKYPLFNADKEVQNIYNQKDFKSKISKKFKIKSLKNIKSEIKKIIINNKILIKDIEKIIHPLVRKKIKIFIKKNKKKKLIFFEIPLLIESKLMKDYDIIIFINSKKNIRLKRYLKRGKNKEIFNLLDKRQLLPSKKIKFCDYVINNNKDLKKLKRIIKSIKNKI